MNHKRQVFPMGIGRCAVIFRVVLVLSLPGRLDCFSQSAINHETARPKRVLMLFNEGKDAPGNIVLEQAVQAEMQKAGTNRIEFLEEHLDSSQFSDDEHFRLFQDYLGKKYAGKELDLIMTFPSRDYRIAGELPEAVFPGVPVVFVAINELDVPPALGKAGVVGIVQRFDLRGTLGLMVRLQPDTRRVVVVGGVSEVDHATLDRIAEISQGLEGIKFEFWTNRPATELRRAVRTLPEGTVVLLSTVLRDVNGQTFYMAQLAQTLSASASVPIYVFGGWVLGSGAVGGSVVDAEDLGARAGRLALRVLDGQHSKLPPVEVVTKGTPMVDWRALRRWNLDETRVPDGAVVRYRPETLWEGHRDLILILLAVFLAQTGTITELLAQRRKRRRAEEEILNQRTELAHVSRVSTMGQLTSTLAHELNQPLGAILRKAQAADIFLQNEKPDLDEIRAISADIRKDVERAGSVIERMRSLLKRRNLELKPLNLGGLLSETIALAQPDARVRSVKLTLQMPALLPTVRGDRVHLQQVVLNLILNGMDAMTGVNQAERVLRVMAAWTKAGSVEVAVSDGGTGIPPDKLERLFEPFFTTKSNGMGMGLAISQTIIEAHGGKIHGGNNAGGGAVFKFTLPANEN